MGFYARICREEEGRIPVHMVIAVIREIRRGKTTAAAAKTFFNLTNAERDEAAALVQKITNGDLTESEVEDALYCADGGFTGYATSAQLKARLGIP